MTSAGLAAQQDWLRLAYLPGTDARMANNSEDNSSSICLELLRLAYKVEANKEQSNIDIVWDSCP